MSTPGWRRFTIATIASLFALAGAVAVGPAPAQAAVPDKIAFVLWNGAVVASGTTPAGTTVTPLSPGRYQVKFVGAGIGAGVVHVTAINAVPHWCQVETWFQSGPDEIVVIRCYKVGPSLDNTAFSAIFFRSSGTSPFGQYGYVDAMPGGGTFSQYNSAGGTDTVTHLAVGQWSVKFAGIGTPGPRDGGLQATAVNAGTPARCNIATWASSPPQQAATVFCFDATGAPLDTRFTLTYQYSSSLYGSFSPPFYYGFVWWMPGVGPASTNLNSILGYGGNAPASAGVGLTIIKFPSIGVAPPDTVLVTAATAAPNWCSLNSVWTHPGATDILVRDVNCFTNAGTPANTPFTASANSIN
jgi:hypothetical protein